MGKLLSHIDTKEKLREFIELAGGIVAFRVYTEKGIPVEDFEDYWAEKTVIECMQLIDRYLTNEDYRRVSDAMLTKATG